MARTKNSQTGRPLPPEKIEKEVAPELPDKIEQVLYLDLTEDQKDCYENVRKSAEHELDQLADAGASEGAIRMKTLTQLLRLAKPVVILV